MEHGKTVTRKHGAVKVEETLSTAGTDTTKTTVKIPRPLLARAKAAAAVSNPRSSVQSMLLRGLAMVVDQMEGKPCQA
jgi:hypothetical protein